MLCNLFDMEPNKMYCDHISLCREHLSIVLFDLSSVRSLCASRSEGWLMLGLFGDLRGSQVLV